MTSLGLEAHSLDVSLGLET